MIESDGQTSAHAEENSAHTSKKTQAVDSCGFVEKESSEGMRAFERGARNALDKFNARGTISVLEGGGAEGAAGVEEFVAFALPPVRQLGRDILFFKNASRRLCLTQR